MNVAYQFPFKAMGSPCELILYAADEQHAQNTAQAAIDEVKRLEVKYSRYRDDSVTSAINRNAGEQTFVDIDEETDGLLNYANTAYEISDGLFDITAGVLRRAWDFKSAQLPPKKQLQRILGLIGWNKVERREQSVRLPFTGMELDFGGYVKEYAVDNAVDICRHAGIQHGLVDLGGDIGVIGGHPDGEPWQIGIRHPRNPKSAIAAVQLTSGALASSGDYERFFIKDGRRFSHIMNPKTGYPEQGAAGISVVAERCLIAGTTTTIAMLQPENQSEPFLQRMKLPFLAVRQNMTLTGTITTS